MARRNGARCRGTDEHKRVKTTLICLALLMSTACRTTQVKDAAPPADTTQTETPKEMAGISGTGTIRFLEFEGGFYGIVADNGRRYDPGTLQQKFRKDGLRVKFVVRERVGVMSIRMWGTPVELVSLEAL